MGTFYFFLPFTVSWRAVPCRGERVVIPIVILLEGREDGGEEDDGREDDGREENDW